MRAFSPCSLFFPPLFYFFFLPASLPRLFECHSTPLLRLIALGVADPRANGAIKRGAQKKPNTGSLLAEAALLRTARTDAGHRGPSQHCDEEQDARMQGIAAILSEAFRPFCLSARGSRRALIGCCTAHSISVVRAGATPAPWGGSARPFAWALSALGLRRALHALSAARRS